MVNTNTIYSVILTIFGSFFSALSLILMKWAHNKQEENPGRSVVKDVNWIIGFLSLILGSVLNVVALSYGNQLLLASTSSLSIIFNTLMAVIFLKETLHRSDIIAITLICTGSLLFLLLAKNQDTEYTEKQLFDLYLSPLSLIFISLSILWIAFVYKYDQILKKKVDEWITYILSIQSSLNPDNDSYS